MTKPFDLVAEKEKLALRAISRYMAAAGLADFMTEQRQCEGGRHVWSEDATADGDTCECGAWYRFADRIEQTPPIER